MQPLGLLRYPPERLGRDRGVKLGASAAAPGSHVAERLAADLRRLRQLALLAELMRCEIARVNVCRGHGPPVGTPNIVQRETSHP